MENETSGPVDDGVSELTLDEAAALMGAPDDDETNSPEGAADTAAPTGQESASKEDDAAPEGTTVEGDEDEPDVPAIDPPKSWSKDAHERWSKLDRDTQEFLASRDSEDQKAIKRSLNEAAETRKAAQAEATKADQARQTFEQKARDALSILAREQQRDYADIKTVEDVTKLAVSDPLRYLAWDAHQKELAAIKQTVDDADRRKADTDAKAWSEFRREQDKLALEHIPDLGDKVKAPKLMEKAVSLLQDVGFTAAELGKLDNGEKLSLFDHRIQRLIFDATRFRDMQSAKTVQLKKPVPTVQRPGVQAPKRGSDANLQALSHQLTNSGSVEDAWRLYEAELKGSQRRAS